MYKYAGMRSMEDIENYALNGGYLTNSAPEEIPKHLEGFAYW